MAKTCLMIINCFRQAKSELLTIGPWFRDNLISYLGEEQDTPSLQYELPRKNFKPEQAAWTSTPGCYRGLLDKF